MYRAAGPRILLKSILLYLVAGSDSSEAREILADSEKAQLIGADDGDQNFFSLTYMHTLIYILCWPS